MEKLKHDTSKYKITNYGQISHMSFCTDKSGYPNVSQTVKKGVFENIESKLNGKTFVEITETERIFQAIKKGDLSQKEPEYNVHKEVFVEGEERRFKNIHDLIYSYDFGENLEYQVS